MFRESMSHEANEEFSRKSRLAARLAEAARFAGILEGPEPSHTNSRDHIKRSFARKIVSGSLVAAASVASTLLTSEALDYRPAVPAHVEIMPGLPTAEIPPNYRSNRVFLSIRGFGREVACEMASASQPLTSEYGQAACLVMNPKQIDQTEIVNALEHTLLPLADETTGELELNIHAQSAGAKMTLDSINGFLERNKNASVNLFFLDGAPHDKADVLGTGASLLVNNPQLAKGGHVVGTAFQAISLSKDYAHHALYRTQTWEDAFAQAITQPTSGLRAQAEAIGRPLGDMSALAASDPRLIYVKPDEPEVDTFVDIPKAYDGWRKEFGQYDMELSQVSVDINSHTPVIRGGQDTQSYLDTFSLVFEEKFTN